MRHPPPRPPLKSCPVCRITMVASKSREGLADFDTFTCLNCGAVTTLSPPKPKEAPRP
jgi:hypothetical protein